MQHAASTPGKCFSLRCVLVSAGSEEIALPMIARHRPVSVDLSSGESPQRDASNGPEDKLGCMAMSRVNRSFAQLKMMMMDLPSSIGMRGFYIVLTSLLVAAWIVGSSYFRSSSPGLTDIRKTKSAKHVIFRPFSQGYEFVVESAETRYRRP